MGTDKDSGHAECLRQQRNKNAHSDRGADDEIFIIDRAAFNQGENARYDIEIHRGGGSADNRGERSACGSRPCPSWDKVGALCATDYKWVQQEQVDQGKIIPVLRL